MAILSAVWGALCAAYAAVAAVFGWLGIAGSIVVVLVVVFLVVVVPWLISNTAKRD